MNREEWDEVVVEPFRASRGFFAFVSLMILPALIVVVVYFGAWLVADEVYAAEQARSAADFSAGQESSQVAGWKQALVGICPAH